MEDYLMMQDFMVSGWLPLMNDWSALRFRNIKFIKSTSGRFTK